MKSLLLCAMMAASVSSGEPVAPSPPAAADAVKTPQAIQVEDLARHWVRSVEEEKEGGKEQVFRPADFKKFPPSRFRMAYKFAKTGDCEWLYLAPTDAHQFKPGKWTLDPAEKTVLHLIKGDVTESYRITQLTKDRLSWIPVASAAEK